MNEKTPFVARPTLDVTNYSFPPEFLKRLVLLGIAADDDVRHSNVGQSDYSRHIIQPWSIWKDYDLNPWDADIVKRVLRVKGTTDKEKRTNRVMDYQKIIHICQERLRQLSIESSNE